MNGFVRRTEIGDRYSRLLENHVVPAPALRQRGCLTITIFMQDGATVNTVRCVKNVIQANFSDERVISPYFPDFLAVKVTRSETLWLLAADFSQRYIYQGRVNNLVDFKGSIVCHVSHIPTDMLRAAVDNAVVRFQHIVDQQGMHIEYPGV